MDIRKLNEQLEKFLEGEVINFTDFRNKKLGLEKRTRRTISDDDWNTIKNDIIKDLDNDTDEVPDSINKNQDALNAPYVKDYRKDPQDVQVGDILSMTWGYSMTIVDYYKVIERKKSSIRLAALNTVNITGDGWSGTCIPGTEIVKDNNVDGKLFRIGTKWSNEIVCRINGHGVYYWDGKPDAYDRND